MGFTHEEFTLKNGVDVVLYSQGHITEGQIRQVTANFLVDTGAGRLFITEEIQRKLKLPEKRTDLVTIGGGEQRLCKVVGPVEIGWHDRWDTMEARIMPGQDTPIVGVLPLEALDLKVNPTTQKVEGAHGEERLELLL
jgi:clan AA aspartic protease